MAADPSLRTIFIDSIVEFCAQFGFEGVDFDWEYPSFFEGSSMDDKGGEKTKANLKRRIWKGGIIAG
jgi:GH18 family chitinase